MNCTSYNKTVNELLNSLFVAITGGGNTLNVVDTAAACGDLIPQGCSTLTPRTIEEILNALIGVDACGNPALKLNLNAAILPPVATNFQRLQVLNPTVGTTVFNFVNPPTAVFPPQVYVGGTILASTDYSIVGTTITLVNPISASGGGAGGEDFIAYSSY